MDFFSFNMNIYKAKQHNLIQTNISCTNFCGNQSEDPQIELCYVNNEVNCRCNILISLDHLFLCAHLMLDCMF